MLSWWVLVIFPLSGIYFASIFPLLLFFFSSTLWQLWCYGISKRLCCKIHQSEAYSSVVGKSGAWRFKMLHSWTLSELYLFSDFKQNPFISLNFSFANSISPSCSASAPAPQDHGRSFDKPSHSDFSVKWIYWWTLRSTLPAQVLAGAVCSGHQCPVPDMVYLSQVLSEYLPVLGCHLMASKGKCISLLELPYKIPQTRCL